MLQTASGVWTAKLWPQLDTVALADRSAATDSSALQRAAVSEHRSWRADVVPAWRTSSTSQQLEAMEGRDPIGHTLDPLLDVVRAKDGAAPLTQSWHERSTKVWRGTAGVMASPRPAWRDHTSKLWQPMGSEDLGGGSKLPGTPSPYLPPFADLAPRKGFVHVDVGAARSEGTVTCSTTNTAVINGSSPPISVESFALNEEEAWRAVVAWNREAISADRKDREAEAHKRALAERRLELSARAERARLHALDMRKNVDDHIAFTIQTNEYRAWAALPRIAREKKHDEVYAEKLKDYTARIFSQCP